MLNLICVNLLPHVFDSAILNSFHTSRSTRILELLLQIAEEKPGSLHACIYLPSSAPIATPHGIRVVNTDPYVVSIPRGESHEAAILCPSQET